MTATPSRTFEEARDWARLGTALLIGAADADAAVLDAPSLLPGWTRGHVVAHVAANADALGNLVHWAATGEKTPMYASPEERAEGIARGAVLSAAELTAWLRESAAKLEAATAALDAGAWAAEVVTAQGRTVPATELPWMRSREVCVHAVDLGRGVSFADLPDRFLAALCDDVAARRAAAPGPAAVLVPTDAEVRWELPGTGDPVEVTGPLHELTAYLTGRPAWPTTRYGAPVPELGPWL
ncbi:maleylpyruvate isomerase family mycothiol-dependent enzyme [Streptomyces sp. CRN 30]|uniref:maleylpyruvate isomerase family mycothiol-dependent enzyme n=1 Tax=Streptomyces sp. CRN 30 TaxID=3075613 RepID=UPI002A7FC1F8|nr:maleylpyruvate isomerase family mycothiol-dependent enzyme [Streptomyces sp. CRN 30]